MTATDHTPGEGLIDPYAVLASLAKRRALFHSEADFQFAFAWESKTLNPGLEVRLETHPEPGVRLDLELIDPDSSRGLAVELKSMTRLWAGARGGESFELKNHGASDLRAYDVVKDIARFERFVGERSGWAGLVIAITNEAAYRRASTQGVSRMRMRSASSRATSLPANDGGDRTPVAPREAVRPH